MYVGIQDAAPQTPKYTMAYFSIISEQFNIADSSLSLALRFGERKVLNFISAHLSQGLALATATC